MIPEIMNQWESKKVEMEMSSNEKNKELHIRIGQFMGALAIHMAMAGGTVDLEALIDEPLGGILEICFRNGISFEIKNEHISSPVFSPIFGKRSKGDKK